jgi:hypothetical protein
MTDQQLCEVLVASEILDRALVYACETDAGSGKLPSLIFTVVQIADYFSMQSPAFSWCRSLKISSDPFSISISLFFHYLLIIFERRLKVSWNMEPIALEQKDKILDTEVGMRSADTNQVNERPKPSDGGF